MAEKKKPGKVLVKVSELSEEQLDKALDHALDALFGPDEEEDTGEKPGAKNDSAKRMKPVRSRKNK